MFGPINNSLFGVAVDDNQSFNIESGHTQEYHVRDLDTRSVTLFPSRAQVVRDLRDVRLKRDEPNHIIIAGLTPTIDEHSIKVEGSGAAIITDIAVISRPNPESFDDVRPESDDAESESDEGDTTDDDQDGDEDETLTGVRDRIALLQDEEKRAKEVIASAESRLKIIESYSRLLTTERRKEDEICTSITDGVGITDGVETYRSEREKVFQDHMQGTVKWRDLAKQISKLEKEASRLRKHADKEKAKAEKAKAKTRRSKEKEREKKERKRDSAAKEKARARRERENFWPKKVFMLKVTLEAASFAPVTSRRSSMSSDILKIPEMVEDHEFVSGRDEDAGTCDITISYVTSCAYWSPNYDLALSTTANSGILCFDALLKNMTSETWSNCKIILSTSQANFSGPSDNSPTMVPWRVKLMGKGHPGQLSQDLLYSKDEISRRSGWANQQYTAGNQPPRWQLFGVDRQPQQAFPRPQPAGGLFGQAAPPPVAAASAPTSNSFGAAAGTSLFGAQQQQDKISSSSSFGAAAATPAAPATTGGGLFGGNPSPWGAPPQSGGQAPISAGGFGSSTSGVSAFGRPTLGGSLFGSTIDKQKEDGLFGGHRDRSEDNDDETTTEAQPLAPELSFQESSFEETGLTSTYDLPGLKTLAPSSTPSKQRVVRVTFSSVAFSHTVVARHKPAAYLKAKIRNGSSQLTILQGPAGLTLDGSFLGRTTIPRCSPGDSFTLSLGVDPAIRVAYPKPDVKRSQSGLFSKDDSGVYTRIITLVNTRSNAGSSGNKGTGGSGVSKPVKVTVLDQVPVSEDEKLRIDILQPRGMVIGSTAGVATGVPGREGEEEKDWGKALATLKKGGEVTWDVTLNAGRMAKLSLVYEASFPAGEQVVNV